MCEALFVWNSASNKLLPGERREGALLSRGSLINNTWTHSFIHININNLCVIPLWALNSLYQYGRTPVQLLISSQEYYPTMWTRMQCKYSSPVLRNVQPFARRTSVDSKLKGQPARRPKKSKKKKRNIVYRWFGVNTERWLTVWLTGLCKSLVVTDACAVRGAEAKMAFAAGLYYMRFLSLLALLPPSLIWFYVCLPWHVTCKHHVLPQFQQCAVVQ